MLLIALYLTVKLVRDMVWLCGIAHRQMKKICTCTCRRARAESESSSSETEAAEVFTTRKGAKIHLYENCRGTVGSICLPSTVCLHCLAQKMNETQANPYAPAGYTLKLERTGRPAEAKAKPRPMPKTRAAPD